MLHMFSLYMYIVYTCTCVCILLIRVYMHMHMHMYNVVCYIHVYYTLHIILYSPLPSRCPDSTALCASVPDHVQCSQALPTTGSDLGLHRPCTTPRTSHVEGLLGETSPEPPAIQEVQHNIDHGRSVHFLNPTCSPASPIEQPSNVLLSRQCKLH